jgi:hypothetical protein
MGTTTTLQPKDEKPKDPRAQALQWRHQVKLIEYAFPKPDLDSREERMQALRDIWLITVQYEH